MRFSKYFGLRGNQSDFDFLDIPLHTDIKVFFDPYALVAERDAWMDDCHSLVHDFFSTVLDKLRENAFAEAVDIVARVHEDNRTRTGFSRSQPRGSGFGPEKAQRIVDALKDSEAFKTGQLIDVEDTALFIPSIGIDLVSDIMISVLSERLADYTIGRCQFHDVQMPFHDTFNTWRAGAGWTKVTRQLPVVAGNAVLLLPLVVMRKDLSLQAAKYFTGVFNAADAHDPRATDTLTKLLQTLPRKKGGKIGRQKAREKLGEAGIKENAARAAANDPESLRRYKAKARSDRRVLTRHQVEALQPDDDPVLAVQSANILSSRNLALDEALLTLSHPFMASMFPLLRQPDRVNTSIDGLIAVKFRDTTASGVLPRQQDQLDLLIVKSSRAFDRVDGGLNWKSIRTVSKSAAMLIVSPDLAQYPLQRRKALGKDYVFVVEEGTLPAMQGFMGSPWQALEQLRTFAVA